MINGLEEVSVTSKRLEILQQETQKVQILAGLQRCVAGGDIGSREKMT